MKFFPAIFALALLGVFGAPGQVVRVQVSLSQKEFLPGESLPATVRVFNDSGQTLHLGADRDWLTFGVTSADGQYAPPQKSQPPVVGPFDLGSMEVAIKRVNLAPYFALNKLGSYQVVAMVHIAAWGKDVSSAPAPFDIIDGAELWQRDFGVPLPAGVTNRAPEVRKYILEEANYLQRQLRLYVLVSNQSRSRIFKAEAIGPMVSFSTPQAELDERSDLHVLYQSGARSFIYAVIAPDGSILSESVYDLWKDRPRLEMLGNGSIAVVGGVPRVAPHALPVIDSPNQVPVNP
ncbi:MAG: hypothetical protein KGR98_11110 [Verrucomicrobia bacterium]|nr:hypothetical protein [Verrucomicrobiota bacterium]MDE3099230.1 hypothetical protein [Verrucomicrobiota bacterium]